MFFLEGIYATAYALELASTSLDDEDSLQPHPVLWRCPSLAPCWLLLAMRFGWRDRKPKWLAESSLALLVPIDRVRRRFSSRTTRRSTGTIRSPS
ncbi:MAG: hypothetical protein MZU79_01630 [Anaerotruncus sp.]|nr:hypothetical protein [Anaerotruncus sp.]